MATHKRKPPKKPRKRPASTPVEHATLPDHLPRPDLALWILAGLAGIVAVASFCTFAEWAVLRLAGVAQRPPDAFWRAVEYEDFAAAAKLAPPAWVGWAALLGPLLLLALPWLAARWTNAWLLGAAIGAAVRLLAPAWYVALVMLAYLRGTPMPRLVSLEEYRVQALFGIPVGFSLLAQAVILAAGFLRALPRFALGEQPARLLALAAGACFGFGILALWRAS